ncbi:MAG: hypothetical protein IPG67_14730 [Acidobacteria bacterium]|nr:hypothetical protein [Acidobacteriota bacterium]
MPNINGKSLRLDYNDDDLTLQTAAVFIWSGAVDGNWNDPANWQGGQVPTADGLVEIPETGVVNSPDLGSMSVNVANLVVGDGQNVIVGDGQTITVDGVLNSMAAMSIRPEVRCDALVVRMAACSSSERTERSIGRTGR